MVQFDVPTLSCLISSREFMGNERIRLSGFKGYPMTYSDFKIGFDDRFICVMCYAVRNKYTVYQSSILFDRKSLDIKSCGFCDVSSSQQELKEWFLLNEQRIRSIHEQYKIHSNLG